MKTIDINRLEQMVLNKNHDEILMDVRTPAEFEAGHIPGFENHPLDTLKDNLEKYRGKKIVVSCKSGGRAAQAVKILEPVADMRCYSGSFDEWQSEHKRIIKLDKHRFSLPVDRQLFILVGVILIVSFFIPFGNWIALIMGSGLAFAGISGICFLHMALSKMPWNR